jgi:hypothetical protein
MMIRQGDLGFFGVVSRFLGVVIVFLMAAPGFSEPLHPGSNGLYTIAKHHELGPEETTKSWEYWFDLPKQGFEVSFWKRRFRASDSLVVEEEAMSNGVYYVKVRITESYFGGRRGSLYVWVEPMDHGPTDKRPEPPEIEADFSQGPDFEWNNPAETLSVDLYERRSGELLHRQVFLDVYGFGYNDDLFTDGGEYLLIASQSDEWGRCSASSYLAFGMELVEEKCRICNGSGILPGYPGTECYKCKGNGVISRPEFFHEDMSVVAGL